MIRDQTENEHQFLRHTNSAVCHEIRNPLNSLDGHIALINYLLDNMKK